MKPKPGKLDKKHPDVARDAMEDIKEIAGSAKPIRNDIKYMEPNRDRARGENDRTGRHFDEEPQQEAQQKGQQESRDGSDAASKESTAASKEREAD